MPTKHIDAVQWAGIEAMTVDLIKETNAPVKEGDVLKEVIAAGLEALSAGGLSNRFSFHARYSVIVMSKLKSGGNATLTLTTPTVDAVAAMLDERAGFIVCVYGNANTGRTTFAQELRDKLEAAENMGVKVYDDAATEDISQGWADYQDGKGAIVVVNAKNQMLALERLYSTHRSPRKVEDCPQMLLEPDNTDRASLIRQAMRGEPKRLVLGKRKQKDASSSEDVMTLKENFNIQVQLKNK